jgi:hypothetical protein
MILKCILDGVCFEMPENEEEPTAVYAKKVHKGGSDEVNRVISKQTLDEALVNDTYLALSRCFVL